MRITLLCLASLALAQCTTAQTEPKFLERVLAERESQISRLETVWQVEEKSRYPDGQSNTLSAALTGTEQQARVQPYADGWTFTLHIQRVPILDTEKSPPQIRSFKPASAQWVLLKQSPIALIGGRLMENNSVDPDVVPLYFGDMFWKVEGGAVAVLTGMNPLRLIDQGWKAQKEGDVVRIVGRLVPDIVVLDAVPEIEVELDPARGYAPVRITARTANFREEIVVQEWRRTSDPALPRWMRESRIWLPARFDGTIRLDLRQNTVMLRHKQYRLMEVRSASGTAPQWLKRDVVVRDYRLGAQLGRHHDMYQLQGRIPSLVELQRMREKRNKANESVSALPSWMRIAPPAIMIAVGLLWYRRTAQST